MTRNVKRDFEKLLVEQSDVDEALIEPDADLHKDLGLDSLDDIELVMAAEIEFQIEIPDSDVERIYTVSEAVKYLEQRLAEKKK